MTNLNVFNEIKSPFTVENLWAESGTNYSRTLELWLEKLKSNVKLVVSIFIIITMAKRSEIRLMKNIQDLLLI